jgi:hypothetical protein
MLRAIAPRIANTTKIVSVEALRRDTVNHKIEVRFRMGRVKLFVSIHVKLTVFILNGDIIINLIKSTGHVMHQQFNTQQLYVLPTHCIYVFCIYLRTNSDLCHLHHKLIGFFNRDEKCLLRGTNWVFK